MNSNNWNTKIAILAAMAFASAGLLATNVAAASNYQVLHSFSGPDGVGPNSVILASDGFHRLVDQRMLRPTCSTIRRYALRGADGFSPFHAMQASVLTVGFSGRNTTFSCASLLTCSGTRATPNPRPTAWIMVCSSSTSCKTFGAKPTPRHVLVSQSR
jgi:hypothetical protein